MPNIRAVGSTETSIVWEIYDLSYPAYQYQNFQIEVWRGSSLIDTMNWTTNSSYRYTRNTTFGLSPGTNYQAKAWVRTPGGTRTYVGDTYYSTDSSSGGGGGGSPPPVGYPPDIPSSFRVTSHTHNAVNLAWSSVWNADYYAVEIYNGSVLVKADYTITNTAVYFGGLSSNTYYSIKLYARNSAGNSAATWTSVTLGSARPSNWNWHTPKVSGQDCIISAAEWNSFCTKINQFREYQGYSYYSFTTVHSGGDIYASYFNEAIIGLRAMNWSVSPPNSVSSGSNIYASDINRLRDCLNSIP